MIRPSVRHLAPVLLWLLGLADRPRRRRKQASAAATSTPRPEGLAQARGMRTPTRVLFTLVVLITSCMPREGCNRPDPPDPVPCKPGIDCPVVGDPPPPLEQPRPATPAPATKVEPDPPPT